MLTSDISYLGQQHTPKTDFHVFHLTWVNVKNGERASSLHVSPSSGRYVLLAPQGGRGLEFQCHNNMC